MNFFSIEGENIRGCGKDVKSDIDGMPLAIEKETMSSYVLSYGKKVNNAELA